MREPTDWAFVDSERRIVWRVNERGWEDSCPVTNVEVQEWIAKGNIPGEPPPEPAPEPTVDTRLKDLEALNTKLLAALELAGIDVSEVRA